MEDGEVREKEKREKCIYNKDSILEQSLNTHLTVSLYSCGEMKERNSSSKTFMWLSQDGVTSDDLYLLLYTVLYDSVSNTFLYDLVKSIEVHFFKIYKLWKA